MYLNLRYFIRLSMLVPIHMLRCVLWQLRSFWAFRCMKFVLLLLTSSVLLNVAVTGAVHAVCTLYVLIFHYSIVLLLYELFICKQEQKDISFDTIAVLCLLLSKDVFPYVRTLSIVNTFGYISTY